MTDPIADMLTRIRNASLARHDRVEMPHSQPQGARRRRPQVRGLPRRRARRARATGAKTLTVVLRYGRDRQSAIDGVRRVSTPGRRVYVRHDRIPRVLLGHGHLDPQHEPRRDDRPRRAQAARRRRAALRGLVIAMTDAHDQARDQGLRQSRVGKRPIELPKGVTRDASTDGTIEVKGPKGAARRADLRRTSTSRSTAGTVAVEPTDRRPRRRALPGPRARAHRRHGAGRRRAATRRRSSSSGTGYRAEVKGRR